MTSTTHLDDGNSARQLGDALIAMTQEEVQELLTAVAVKTLAKAVIISHNHPSGNLMPSEADRSLTRNIVKALK